MTCAYFRPDHCLAERLGESSGGDQSAMHSNTLKEHKKNEGMIEGSCGNRRLRVRIVGWMEFLSEAGTEGAIIYGAANLKQKIGTPSRPAHLLGLVHPAVHQEIGRPFRDRSADPQSGTVPLGVINQTIALAREIAIKRVQGGPQLP